MTDTRDLKVLDATINVVCWVIQRRVLGINPMTDKEDRTWKELWHGEFHDPDSPNAHYLELEAHKKYDLMYDPDPTWMDGKHKRENQYRLVKWTKTTTIKSNVVPAGWEHDD